LDRDHLCRSVTGYWMKSCGVPCTNQMEKSLVRTVATEATPGTTFCKAPERVATYSR